MADITFRGEPVHTRSELPAVGSQAPEIDLVGADLEPVTLEGLRGRRVILNIFPSLDTGVCAMSVRRFNELAAGLENTTVVCVSKDLPFAAKRFCTTEGIENVVTGSAFRSHAMSKAYGLRMVDGPLRGLLARAVVVIDENGRIVHTQLVEETSNEPDYDAAIAALN
ncbi:thiol peroxidase [Propionibacterium australiense]|uniref:Thiol peroxidase n=1 Tax=Propionibacterium australiense TaxID=119981 RepID=A0A383S5G7_9ACTN|nr:thiol peroxidase [Propionibacterium australiense]RLP08172.1 thiol peroxidase [Propionibacterium australiense]RLP08300.1 thiol peroxidase [Propionibacterium australiense]SYZ33083.1 Thiol peroxidase conserved site [Propionibacterium australiense]VEH89086.1 Probable thiol peroxidase [Propionibacterium australiense]